MRQDLVKRTDELVEKRTVLEAKRKFRQEATAEKDRDHAYYAEMNDINARLKEIDQELDALWD